MSYCYLCEVCLSETILLNCIKSDHIVICLHHKRRRTLYVTIITEIYGSTSIHLVSAKWHHASSLWLLLISIQSYNRKWILFSANKLSKIFKNIKHSFFLCKGEIAALVYTKQNNKIKTQVSELYSHKPVQKHCDRGKTLHTGLNIHKGGKSQRFS